MSILMQSAPSLSNDTAVDVDEISAEILKKAALQGTEEKQECLQIDLR